MDVKRIQAQLAAFAKERNWDQFHSPKNLVMALSAEVGELVELFQWSTEQESYQITESEAKLNDVRTEIADVLIYALRLADILNVDIESAIAEKLAVNAQKYPVALSKGNATKYNKREE